MVALDYSIRQDKIFQFHLLPPLLPRPFCDFGCSKILKSRTPIGVECCRRSRQAVNVFVRQYVLPKAFSYQIEPTVVKLENLLYVLNVAFDHCECLWVHKYMDCPTRPNLLRQSCPHRTRQELIKF